MKLPEIEAMASTVDQFIKEGLQESAARLLSDTVPNLVLASFRLDRTTKFLVHYTSIDVLFSMLSCPVWNDGHFALSSSGTSEELGEDSGFLRIYDTYNSNDPNEGQFFVRSKPSRHHFPSRHSDLWKLLVDRSKLPAYVASFRGVSMLEDVDDLVFWRAYGNGGKGCAVVFPVSFIDADTPILQVRYGKKSVRSTLDRLCAVFDSLTSTQSLRHCNPSNATVCVPKYISSCLSPIPYLHKADHYRFENEVRVIVPFVDLPPRSLFCHRIHDADWGLKLRHFANLSVLNIRNILRTDSRILLGPAVPSKSNLSFVLKQRLVNLGLVGTNVCASRIDYRS